MQSLSNKYHYLNSGKIKFAPGDSNDLHPRSNSRLPGGQRQISPLGPLSEGPSRELPPKNNCHQLAKTHSIQKSGGGSKSILSLILFNACTSQLRGMGKGKDGGSTMAHPRG